MVSLCQVIASSTLTCRLSHQYFKLLNFLPSFICFLHLLFHSFVLLFFCLSTSNFSWTFVWIFFFLSIFPLCLFSLFAAVAVVNLLILSLPHSSFHPLLSLCAKLNGHNKIYNNKIIIYLMGYNFPYFKILNQFSLNFCMLIFGLLNLPLMTLCLL